MKKTLAALTGVTPIVRWLLLLQFAFNIGSFLVVPFIAVYLNRSLGYSVAFVGVQLTIKLFAQRGLMLAGGVFTDRFGVQKVMAAGIVARSASFLLFLCGGHAALVSLASATFGLGGALFVPASKAAISALSDPQRKQLMFSLRSTASNLGMAAGGAIGGLLMEVSPVAIFVSAAVVQLSCGTLLLHARLRALQRSFAAEQRTGEIDAVPGGTGAIRRILRTPGIAILAATYAAYIALYSQFEFTLPLAASSLFNNRAVGLLYVVNTLMVFGCQVPLNLFLERRLQGGRILALGFACMALALVGFLVVTRLDAFLALVAFFSIGEILIDPSIDALSSAQVRDRDLGTLFGLFGVISLIGGAIGNAVGARFFHAPGGGGALWMICIVIALLAAVAAEARTVVRRPMAEAEGPMSR
jgi:predicted MFS family arabinose efflux permease